MHRSENLMKRWIGELDESSDMPIHWFDLAEAIVLHREATLLITGKTTKTDPRFRTVQQRSRALLRGEVRQPSL